jgi:predicted PurR-regulated permease PerM
MALYGLGVYLAIQFLEGNLITPIVQQQTVRLPPAITLAMQLIIGLLFGILGVAFVVPLTAAAKVLIEELYVKDALGGPWREDDEKTAATPAALRQIGRPP